jgi:hypothetical protein
MPDVPITYASSLDPRLELTEDFKVHLSLILALKMTNQCNVIQSYLALISQSTQTVNVSS